MGGIIIFHAFGTEGSGEVNQMTFTLCGILEALWNDQRGRWEERLVLQYRDLTNPDLPIWKIVIGTKLAWRIIQMRQSYQKTEIMSYIGRTFRRLLMEPERAVEIRWSDSIIKSDYPAELAPTGTLEDLRLNIKLDISHLEYRYKSGPASKTIVNKLFGI